MVDYADDLILLASVSSVLQTMVKVCQEYGEKHNLVFSTDPNPAKSKTKCLFLCGRLNNIVYPSPIKLDGNQLFVDLCHQLFVDLCPGR